MPGSTNTWEQTILADEGNVLPAEVLSGQLVCETIFKTGESVIHQSKYRVFYEWERVNNSGLI